jgi:hypothetical protein
LSPVLEEMSAEDQFDSTGYIFESRVNRHSLDPVFEQARSKATSFDPATSSDLQSELLEGIRLRRATLGGSQEEKESHSISKS